MGNISVEEPGQRFYCKWCGGCLTGRGSFPSLHERWYPGCLDTRLRQGEGFPICHSDKCPYSFTDIHPGVQREDLQKPCRYSGITSDELRKLLGGNQPVDNQNEDQIRAYLENCALRGEKYCVVCKLHLRNIMLIPCNHLCLCIECSHTKHCPLCNSNCNGRIRVYL